MLLMIYMCVLDNQQCACWQKTLQGRLAGVTVSMYIATSDSRPTAARAHCTSYSCMHEVSIQHNDSTECEYYCKQYRLTQYNVELQLMLTDMLN